MTSLPQKQRIICLFLFLALGYSIIFYNLFTLQIKQFSFFTHKAQQQYSIPLTTYPPRGLIYDRNYQPLALNKEVFSAFIIPHQLQEAEKLKIFLNQHFPSVAQRLETCNKSNFLFIKRHLTDEEKQFLEKAHLIDIHFLKESARFYPLECSGPVVGVTGIDNQGLLGIELFFNDLLAGKPTSCILEKDARSEAFYFKKDIYLPGCQGQSIILTLDSTLQFLTYEELKKTIEHFESESGCALIMNPANGHLLAMVNYPDFNPNLPLNSLEHTKNSTLADTYEFGSVIKTFLAVAALEEQVTDLDELIDCKNTHTTTINGIRVNNPFVHGILSFADVIAVSNNIGTAQVALRLGPKLYEHYKRCGFGEKTGIQLPGEQAGFVNPPSLWSKPSIVSLSFGYEIRATLLQLAQAFCMIANGGLSIQPCIILDPPQPTKPQKQSYNKETIHKLLTVLEKTVLKGSAQKAQIAGYTIRAKTGTANLLDETGKYDPHQNIFTCAVLVEKDSYKRLVVVFIKKANKKNIFAGTVAAPLAERIIERMLIHENVIH